MDPTAEQARDRKFQCNLCQRLFNRQSKLERHALTHTGERPFTCPEVGCGKTYTRMEHLRRHEACSHANAEPQFTCDFEGCGSKFYTRQHLSRHMKLHLKPKPFLCTVEGCSESFSKHTQLKRHLCLHTGLKPYPCPLLVPLSALSPDGSLNLKNRFFRSSSASPSPSVSAAASTSTSPQPEDLSSLSTSSSSGSSSSSLLPALQAQVIPKPGPRTSEEEPEEDLSEGEEMVRCPAAFEYPSQLERHMDMVHRRVQRHFCGFEGCQKGFVYMRDLQEHIRTSHEKGFVQCPDCSKVLSLSSFDSHRRSHDPSRSVFACTEPVGHSVCGHTFTSKSNLKKHVEGVHWKERPFKCEECSKGFLSKQQLDRHRSRRHQNPIEGNNTNILNNHSHPHPHPHHSSSLSSSYGPFPFPMSGQSSSLSMSSSSPQCSSSTSPSALHQGPSISSFLSPQRPGPSPRPRSVGEKRAREMEREDLLEIASLVDSPSLSPCPSLSSPLFSSVSFPSSFSSFSEMVSHQMPSSLSSSSSSSSSPMSLLPPLAHFPLQLQPPQLLQHLQFPNLQDPSQPPQLPSGHHQPTHHQGAHHHQLLQSGHQHQHLLQGYQQGQHQGQHQEQHQGHNQHHQQSQVSYSNGSSMAGHIFSLSGLPPNSNGNHPSHGPPHHSHSLQGQSHGFSHPLQHPQHLHHQLQHQHQSQHQSQSHSNGNQHNSHSSLNLNHPLPHPLFDPPSFNGHNNHQQQIQHHQHHQQQQHDQHDHQQNQHHQQQMGTPPPTKRQRENEEINGAKYAAPFDLFQNPSLSDPSSSSHFHAHF